MTPAGGADGACSTMRSEREPRARATRAARAVAVRHTSAALTRKSWSSSSQRLRARWHEATTPSARVGDVLSRERRVLARLRSSRCRSPRSSCRVQEHVPRAFHLEKHEEIDLRRNLKPSNVCAPVQRSFGPPPPTSIHELGGGRATKPYPHRTHSYDSQHTGGPSGGV